MEQIFRDVQAVLETRPIYHFILPTAKDQFELPFNARGEETIWLKESWRAFKTQEG